MNRTLDSFFFHSDSRNRSRATRERSLASSEPSHGRRSRDRKRFNPKAIGLPRPRELRSPRFDPLIVGTPEFSLAARTMGLLDGSQTGRAPEVHRGIRSSFATAVNEGFNSSGSHSPRPLYQPANLFSVSSACETGARLAGLLN